MKDVHPLGHLTVVSSIRLVPHSTAAPAALPTALMNNGNKRSMMLLLSTRDRTYGLCECMYAPLPTHLGCPLVPPLCCCIAVAFLPVTRVRRDLLFLRQGRR